MFQATSTWGILGEALIVIVVGSLFYFAQTEYRLSEDRKRIEKLKRKRRK